jgi:hypothetical protein
VFAEERTGQWVAVIENEHEEMQNAKGGATLRLH